MRVKLDENLGLRGVAVFKRHGHDVASVAGQRMQSASDRDVILACMAEQRCLVTLDLDFSDPLRFPPHEYSGIAVLRLPRQALPADLNALMSTLAVLLAERLIDGKLWIVQRSGVREYQPDDDAP